MTMRIDGGQPTGNNTGFSTEELTKMSAKQLITIFDRNGSNTISEKELRDQGIEGEDLEKIQAHIRELEEANNTKLEEIRETKNGFTMEELLKMLPAQLLTIFDRNDSETISVNEIKEQVGEEYLGEIKACVAALGIKEEEQNAEATPGVDTAKQEQSTQPKPAAIKPNPVRNKIKHGEVEFYEDEVLYHGTRIDHSAANDPEVHTVVTNFGTIEYRDDERRHHELKSSFLGGKMTNLFLWSYKGTKNKDTLHLQNSVVLSADIKDGKADVIYLDNEKSGFGTGMQNPQKFDNSDKIIYRKRK